MGPGGGVDLATQLTSERLAVVQFQSGAAAYATAINTGAPWWQ